MSNECEEYIDFVTRTIQSAINDQYSIQGRHLDYLTSQYAEKNIECLKDLANSLGVKIE